MLPIRFCRWYNIEIRKSFTFTCIKAALQFLMKQSCIRIPFSELGLALNKLTLGLSERTVNSMIIPGTSRGLYQATRAHRFDSFPVEALKLHLIFNKTRT